MVYQQLIKKLFCLQIILLISIYHVNAQQPDSLSKISLLFIGDIMGHDTQIASALDKKMNTYDYNDVFQYIKPVISDADVAVANLEVTLAGPPYKGYPQFSSPAELAVACANAGIDYFALANNHSADRGSSGIVRTINKLDSLGIPHTGTYLNQQARDTLVPLIIRKNGFSIALLNYTYSTNGIKVPLHLIVDSLNKKLITSDIERSKKLNPDAIVLFLHWGTEYDTVPGKAQIDLAEELLAAGADLIIGSHPHVIQKMIWTKNDTGRDGFYVYSLGNFVSNQRKPKTDGGAMVRIELTKVNGVTKIENAGYYLTWVYTPIVDSRTRFYILPCTVFEDRPEFFTNPDDYTMMMKFINDSRNLLNTQNTGIPEIIHESASLP